MKKSSFVALALGTVSTMMFSIGMCMALLPEWNAFEEGVIFGIAGLALGVITILVWRKMEHKAPLRLSAKAVRCIAAGVGGVLQLGIGMCMVMVWEKQTMGILVGIGGIVLLLLLIPMVKGIKK